MLEVPVHPAFGFAKVGRGGDEAVVRTPLFNICQTRGNMDAMPTSIGFRPTPEDARILREAGLPGEGTSDTLRRALRLLDHERWLVQFRADAETLKGEELNTEPEAW